jgi:DNA-directed RNA polymerase specialized sigma24 family protein
MVVVSNRPQETEFIAFARGLEPRLRVALLARFGPVRGRELTAETIAWAWEHWDQVAGADNPGGLLYRVGVRRANRWRWTRPLARWSEEDRAGPPWVEPGLPRALGRLSPAQRQAVVLVEGYGLTYAEVADLLGVRRATVQTHVRRALERLRSELGVDVDA